jgi:hypothetical protein
MEASCSLEPRERFFHVFLKLPVKFPAEVDVETTFFRRAVTASSESGKSGSDASTQKGSDRTLPSSGGSILQQSS